MDFVSWLIDFARAVGSLLCFQGEQATFKIGTEYFPVCSGCFGIYLGSLIALSSFPLLEKWSKRLYSVKYGLPMLLPFSIYGAILIVEENTGAWIVPGIKEFYFFTGVLFGVTIANAAYNLNLETSYAGAVQKLGRKIWILTLILLVASSPVFFLFSAETAALFAVSLIFLCGFFGLVFFLLTWLTTSLLTSFKEKKSAPSEAVSSILTILVVLACFLIFQYLILESKLELVVLGLLFGIVSLGIFGYSLRKLKLEELGIVKKNRKKLIVYGVLTGLALYLAFAFYRFLLFNESVLERTFVNFTAVPAVFVIVVSEEFFFRGYSIPMLERGIRNTPASCVISSVFFVFYHQTIISKVSSVFFGAGSFFDYEQILLLFLGSLLLSYFFVKNRSLLMPIALHLTWNLLVLT